MAAYGWRREDFIKTKPQPYILFAHGTTWDTKFWPEQYWRELATKAAAAGVAVHICWGNQTEQDRSARIAADLPNVTVLPRLEFPQLFQEIAAAAVLLSVDTGIVHIGNALNVPLLALFGPSRLDLVGISSHTQKTLASSLPCAPCMKRDCRYPEQTTVAPACMAQLSVAQVWHHLQAMLQ